MTDRYTHLPPAPEDAIADLRTEANGLQAMAAQIDDCDLTGAQYDVTDWMALRARQIDREAWEAEMEHEGR